ncbi:MAG: hypothetical protein GQ535_03740 [Rhodobacteraceae bacterium]|nr:hypothetical protein [Paracoccaceae bacterium]
MSNSDDKFEPTVEKFEPTIEEATMSSGLHQQHMKGSLDNLIENRLVDLDKPTLTLNIPSDQNISLADIEADLNAIAKKIGSNVKIQITFTMRKG